MTPLVVALEHGRLLVWVQNGRGWVTRRLPGARERWERWVELGDDGLPGLGGRVLTSSERARLPSPITQDQPTEDTR